MTLTDRLAARGLSPVQVGARIRVTLGHGWVAWIVPRGAGYSLTAEPGAGGAPGATVEVAVEAEAADLALTWLADAAEGGPFTVRCSRCRMITRAATHDCVGRRRRSLFERLRGW